MRPARPSSSSTTGSRAGRAERARQPAARSAPASRRRGRAISTRRPHSMGRRLIPCPASPPEGRQGPDGARRSTPAARPTGPSDRRVATSRPGASLRLPQARAKQTSRRRTGRLPRKARRGARGGAIRNNVDAGPVTGAAHHQPFHRAIVLAIARDELALSARVAGSPARCRRGNCTILRVVAGSP